MFSIILKLLCVLEREILCFEVQVGDVGFRSEWTWQQWYVCLRQPPTALHPHQRPRRAFITNWVDRGRFNLDESDQGMADILINDINGEEEAVQQVLR